MRHRHRGALPAVLLAILAIILGIGAAKTHARANDGKPPAIQLTSQKIVLPFGNRVFTGGDMADTVNEHCLLCHSKGMIDTQPPLTPETWKKEVEKMRAVYGCPLRDDEVEPIVKFISRATSPVPPGAAHAAHP